MLDEILNAIRNSDDEFSGSGLTKRDNHLLDLDLALYHQGALYERNLRCSKHPVDSETKITIYDVDAAYKRLLHPPKKFWKEAFKPLSAGLLVTSSFKFFDALDAVPLDSLAVGFLVFVMVGAVAMGVYAFLKS